MKALAVAALAAAILFALSAVLVPFGGFDPDAFQVPQDDPPVQPAGYAFAIWGVIYLWLIGSAGYGVLRRADDPVWHRSRWPLLASLVVGIFWLPVASRSPEWATVLIWAMLATALLALIRGPSRFDAWTFAYPVGLYAGWLTAASSVSVGLLGAGYGLPPGQVGWAVFAIVLALVIAAAVLGTVPLSEGYAAGVVWALVALVAKNGGTAPLVAWVAASGIAILLALLAARRKAVGAAA